jgi:hypothetical protein
MSAAAEPFVPHGDLWLLCLAAVIAAAWVLTAAAFGITRSPGRRQGASTKGGRELLHDIGSAGSRRTSSTATTRNAR